MKFFKSATEKLFTKEVEYKLHEKVVKDLAEGKKDLGIWGKAFVDADGDEKKTEAVYIKLMVRHFKDTAKSEAELEAIWNENYQREQAEKEEMLRQTQQKKDDESFDDDSAIDTFSYMAFLFLIIIIFVIIALGITDYYSRYN